MKDSIAVCYGFNSLDYYLSWHDDSGMYSKPLYSIFDESYDDTYYLTYDEVDDYQRQSWCKNRGTNHDYKGDEMPHGLYGTCLGDYTCHFGCYWGQNEYDVYPERGGYPSSLDKQGSREDERWNYDNYEQPDYGSLYFGGASSEDDFEESSYGGNWEETMTLYERIFGH